ncbi:MAG: GYF domain-containing protein [Muribaculaceae bacterium]|nr:GYF domain-containing protein [Muribaculaceae bacterium]
MALYFAMIDGERKGPFTLAQLNDAGVRPDTYVWAKGMADWQKADEVADICRHFRQHLFDKMHPSSCLSVESPNDRDRRSTEPRSGFGFGYYNFPMPEEDPAEMQNPPMPTLLIAVMVMLFCFPPTGIVAIYYSIHSRNLWNKAQEIAEGKVKGDADIFRRNAHDASRKAKMWVGITFFTGLIFYAFVVSLLG